MLTDRIGSMAEINTGSGNINIIRYLIQSFIKWPISTQYCLNTIMHFVSVISCIIIILSISVNYFISTDILTMTSYFNGQHKKKRVFLHIEEFYMLYMIVNDVGKYKLHIYKQIHI